MGIEFHVGIKNGEDSLRFEILDSSGLAQEHLTGLIGHSIMPNDYQISKDGTIIVNGKEIRDIPVEWNAKERCHVIPEKLVTEFLGEDVSDLIVEDRFARLPPHRRAGEQRTYVLCPRPSAMGSTQSCPGSRGERQPAPAPARWRGRRRRRRKSKASGRSDRARSRPGRGRRSQDVSLGRGFPVEPLRSESLFLS